MNKKKDIFFCIGAQKSGTTTLHDILNQNKSILLPKEKETHFFSVEELYSNDVSIYFQKYFDQKRLLSNDYLIGEVDPSYCYFEGTSKRIFEAMNDSFNIKFIFILRDPVKRAYSHYLMSKRRGVELLSFEEAIEIENVRIKKDQFSKANFSYLSRGYYSVQIENYFKYFKPENFLFIRFEDDLIKQKEEIFKVISRFLKIDYFNYNFNLKSNPASEPKSKFIRDLLLKNNVVKSFLLPLIPSKKIRRLLKKKIIKLNLKVANNSKLDPDQLKRIYELYYKKEIENLERNLNLDFNSWKH